MGIDGLWIGYEGTRSGYSKQEGRPPEELFPELRAHGIEIPGEIFDPTKPL